MRKPNIDKMSYAELLELRDHVQEGIAQRRTEEQAALREKMEELAAEAGFDLDDIVAKRKVGGKRGKVAPKYRNPKDATQTWTGRGRQPLWLVAELKRGKKLEDFAIS
jgi:DNA-binding protein H-NS